MGSSRFQVTNFRYLTITTAAEVSDNNPDSVTASPYDGIRKGRAVIMNMPNPKPTVLCTKLAPIASRNMYMMFSGISISVTLICVKGLSEHNISLVEVFAHEV